MPAARENEIGRAACPVCRSSSAKLRVSARQLAYVHCDACNCQVFARSDRSDTLLRSMLVERPAAPAPAPAPAAPKPAPAAAAPAPAPALQPAAPAPAPALGGLLKLW